MFFVMPYHDGSLDIHLGTSWDYLRCKDKSSKQLLLHLAKGLHRLINDVEKGKIEGDRIIRGNAYYLKPKTFERFGFKSRDMNLLENILFLMNYFELCLLKSLTHKRLSFVSFTNVKILYSRAEDLIPYKERIKRFADKLNPPPYIPKNEEVTFEYKSNKQQLVEVE
jgi:hypothetical protein